MNKQTRMSSMKDSIRIDATADERPASDSFYATAILLRALFVALIVALAG